MSAMQSNSRLSEANQPIIAGVGGAARPLHRIADVRIEQGISWRRICRLMQMDSAEIRRQEDPLCDLRLSELYRWQNALEVPAADLLADADGPLSTPAFTRARMVRVMKTAAAILETAHSASIRRLAQTLIDQLIEIMPELEGVSAWNTVGQRRTQDELGRVAERVYPATPTVRD